MKEGVIMLLRVKIKGTVIVVVEFIIMLVLFVEKAQVIPEGTEQAILVTSNYWGRVITKYEKVIELVAFIFTCRLLEVSRVVELNE